MVVGMYYVSFMGKLAYRFVKKSVQGSGGKTKKVYYYHLSSWNNPHKLKSTGETTERKARMFVENLLYDEEMKVKKTEENLNQKKSGITLKQNKDVFFIAEKCPICIKREFSGNPYSPRTIEQMRNSFLLLVEKLGDYDILQINQTIIDEFVKTSLETGINKSYLKAVSITLHALKIHYKEYDLDFKTSYIHNRNIKGKEKGLFSQEELNIINVPNNVFPFDRWDMKMFFRLMLLTGMRVGEVQAIRWKKLDFHNNRLTIDENLQSRTKSKIEIGRTKNRRGRITILPKYLKQDLIDYKNNLPYNPTEESFLFQTTDGKPIPYNTILSNFYRAMNKMGIDKEKRRERNLSIHSFRHTLNTNLILKGVPPRLIQEMLGWGDQNIQDVYTHFKPNDISSVHTELENIFKLTPEVNRSVLDGIVNNNQEEKIKENNLLLETTNNNLKNEIDRLLKENEELTEQLEVNKKELDYQVQYGETLKNAYLLVMKDYIINNGFYPPFYDVDTNTIFKEGVDEAVGKRNKTRKVFIMGLDK